MRHFWPTLSDSAEELMNVPAGGSIILVNGSTNTHLNAFHKSHLQQDMDVSPELPTFSGSFHCRLGNAIVPNVDSPSWALKISQRCKMELKSSCLGGRQAV